MQIPYHLGCFFWGACCLPDAFAFFAWVLDPLFFSWGHAAASQPPLLFFLEGVPPSRHPCFFPGGRAAPQTPLLFSAGRAAPQTPLFVFGTVGGRNRLQAATLAAYFLVDFYRGGVPPPPKSPCFFSVRRTVGTDLKWPRWLHTFGGFTLRGGVPPPGPPCFFPVRRTTWERRLSMAAAITLTMGAAIIFRSGHYPDDGLSPLDTLLPCTSGPPAPARTAREYYCSLLIDTKKRRPKDVGGHYLWQRPLP